MFIAERIADTPISYALGCAAWFPLSIWILALVRWMISGDIDVLFGILGIFVALVLGLVAVNPPAPMYSILSFVAIVGTVTLFPFVRANMDRRSLRAIEVEEIARAYEVLKIRPDNVSARFKIARKLYDLGFPGHALAIAERCVSQAPDAFYPEEWKVLGRWRGTPLPPGSTAPLPCVECGQLNPPGDVYCSKCGSAFLLERARGKLLPGTLGKKLLAGWITMICALAGIPWLASVGGTLAAIGIFALMFLAVVVLALAFWQTDKGVKA